MLAAVRGLATSAGAARRVIVVGGVAGGASVAARLRRLDEEASITVLERGPFASFANCGLPYYVGGQIADEGKLLVATPDLFAGRFGIDVQTNTEALRIDTGAKTVSVRGPDGVERLERYDACVLATGAAPVSLPVPGGRGAGIFNLRSIPDSRAIREWIERRAARHVTVVGAGFIGLEVADALRERGLQVALVERLPQLMAVLDAEFGPPLEAELRQRGVDVYCGQGVEEIVHGGDDMRVRLSSGVHFDTDFVIVAAGARPESGLARDAGLDVAADGGVVVDGQMRTSAPGVWAVGDVVQGPRLLDHHPEVVPLAGVANRQGRVAAESIAGRETHMREVQATAVCKTFGITMAMTGALEKGLQQRGWDPDSYFTVRSHPGHHASYFPGAEPLHIKMAVATADGRILGAQALGTAHEAVARRIDVIATTMQLRGTVSDLAECELCYAPQFGSAKDPVNMLGMLANNVLSGDSPLAPWDDVLSSAAAVESGQQATSVVVDVRNSVEFADEGHIPGAINVPLETLRDPGVIGALPAGPLEVCCRVGQRAYVGVRLLRQHGRDARLLSGGYQTYLQLRPQGDGSGYRDVVTPSLR